MTKDTVTAVIGVSSNPSKFGYRIFKSLCDAGYNVYGVSRGGGELFGRKLYGSVSELPQAPETALLVVPPEATLSLVKECAAVGVKTFWMQPGADSDEAEQAARAAGMQTVRGACFMVREGVW